MKVPLEHLYNNFLVQILVVIIAFEVGFLFTTRFWNSPLNGDLSVTPTDSLIPTTEEFFPTDIPVSPTIEATPLIEPTASASPTIVPSEIPTPTP